MRLTQKDCLITIPSQVPGGVTFAKGEYTPTVTLYTSVPGIVTSVYPSQHTHSHTHTHTHTHKGLFVNGIPVKVSMIL